MLEPFPGSTYDGFSKTDLRLDDLDASGGSAWDDGLRLIRDPEDRPPRRRGPTRGAVLGGWAAVLILALGVAYVTQPNRQLDAWADIPPPKADLPPPPAPPPEPARAAPIPAETPVITTVASQASDPSIEAPGAPVSASETDAADSADAAAPPAMKVSKTSAEAPADDTSAPPAKAALAARRTAPSATKVSKAAVETPADDEPAPLAKPVKAVEHKAAPEKKLVHQAQAAKTELPAKPAVRCAGARAHDETCRAAELADLRGRISHAYVEAEKAGTPKSVLKARQAEWAVLKAKAQRKGPGAVAELYRTRAAQLESLAKGSTAHTTRRVGRQEG